MARGRKRKRKGVERTPDPQVELLPELDAASASEDAVDADAAAEPDAVVQRESRADEPQDAGRALAEAPTTPGERDRTGSAEELPSPVRRAPDKTSDTATHADAGAPGESPSAESPSGESPSKETQASAPPKESSPTPDAAPTHPRPAGKQLARAKELVEGGRVEEAIDLYREILADNPDNLKAHNNLGVLFDELKQHDVALEHFSQAERLDPDNIEVLTNYGSSLTSLGRFDEAEDVLRRAQRLAGEDLAVRLGLGVLAFRRGTYALAETELQWVCAREPGHGPAFYYRGEALNRLGRFDEAIAAMERAAELMPTDPRPPYTLGHLFDRAGRRGDAVEMYRRARELQGC